MQCGIGACNIESNSCDCAPGYTGRHCHDCAEGFELAFATFEYYSQSLGCLPLLTPCHEPCSSHRLDLCDCCPSGVFNDAGGCCPLADGALVPPIVDKDGQCCEAGYLDGCGICAPDELYFEGGQFWSSCPQDCESNSDCGYGARPRYLAVGREMRYDGQFEPRHLRQLDLVRPQTCHF